MKVQLRQGCITNQAAFERGDIIDMPDSEAQKYIKAGYGIKAPDQSVECASIAAPEDAMSRTARSRVG